MVITASLLRVLLVTVAVRYQVPVMSVFQVYLLPTPLGVPTISF